MKKSTVATGVLVASLVATIAYVLWPDESGVANAVDYSQSLPPSKQYQERLDTLPETFVRPDKFEAMKQTANKLEVDPHLFSGKLLSDEERNTLHALKEHPLALADEMVAAHIDYAIGKESQLRRAVESASNPNDYSVEEYLQYRPKEKEVLEAAAAELQDAVNSWREVVDAEIAKQAGN
ncbi:MAG: hypothetical protein KDB27_12690 [Planctomycetales bacterium]|nr:hypothetical protein [Planctomycetales bacterium]